MNTYLLAILMALLGSFVGTSVNVDNNQYSTTNYDPAFHTEHCVFDENGGETSHIPPSES